MAAVSSQEQTVNIQVNGVPLQVPKGEIVVEAVKRLGLEVPIFCYHPRMKPVGMCRMCLVEIGFKQPDGSVKMMPKPQTACSLPASEGMVVITDSELIHRDRRGILEFLLINHPLDCPICDRGGECPLQNNTLFYGPSTSRYIEIKRHLPKAFPLSKYVTLDLERCIQCGRCVRFTEEISGDSELAFRFRGAMMTPSTFELRDFSSKFSGNTIEICPVGALTNAKYRFRARPWDLETKPGICTVCSNGCNVWLDYRVGKLARVNGRTSEAVNEEWTCDRGKFGHDWYNSDKRLGVVLVRRNDQLVESDWPTAYHAITDAFEEGAEKVAALAGPSVSNEGLYLLQKLFREVFKSNNIDHRFETHLQTPEQRLEASFGVPQVQSTIASLEEAGSILVFGTSLADEEPIVFLRTRKAWFKNGANVIVASSEPTDADSFASVILRYKPGSENALAASLLAACVESGKASVPDDLKKKLREHGPDEEEKNTGVPARKVREAAKLIEPGGAILTTRGLFNATQAQETLEALAFLAMSKDGKFSCLARGANEMGAEMLGVLPDHLPGLRAIDKEKRGLNTHEILKSCADGKIKALWLVDVDPFEAHSDRSLVQKALESVPFLVVQGTLENEVTKYASVVLPMCAPAEQEGSFTNAEGRVQIFRQILTVIYDTKPAWRIFMEAYLRLKQVKPYFHPEEIMEEIAREVPAFKRVSYSSLDGEGQLLG